MTKFKPPRDVRQLRWTPVSDPDWVKELGPDVPARIVANLRKKVRQ